MTEEKQKDKKFNLRVDRETNSVFLDRKIGSNTVSDDITELFMDIMSEFVTINTSDLPNSSEEITLTIKRWRDK
jgi:hypothetical protein